MFREAIAESRSDRWLQAALILWAVLGTAAVVEASLNVRTHTVYPVYADASRLFWDPGMRPFAKGANYVVRQYAPFFSHLLTPFSMLPDRVGAPLWSLVSLVCLITGFLRFFDHVIPGGMSSRQKAMALALLPWCGLSSLFIGQSNILIAGCLLWGTALVREHRWQWAAFALIIPVLTKSYPVALVAVLAALYPRQLLPRLVLAGLTVIVVPGLFQSPVNVLDQYQEWIRFLVSGEQYQKGFATVCLRSCWEAWFGMIPPKQFLPAQALSGLTVLFAVLAVRQRYRDESVTLTHAYCLASIWLVLFGPASEEATYLLCAAPLAIIMTTAWTEYHGFTVRLGVTVAWALAGPLQTSILGETIRKGVFHARLAPLALSWLFLFQLAHMLCRPKRSPHSHFNRSPSRFSTTGGLDIAGFTRRVVPGRWLPRKCTPPI